MEEIMEDEKDRSATTADRQQGDLTESSSTGTQEDNQVPKSDQSLDPPL